MSNSSDFVIKNAIEVGKDTKVTLGTIASGTVDLSTGNYFAETLAADTTYTFSNSGGIQSFQMEVTGASTYVITWPTSVEWPSGVAPSSPAAGETNLYTFSTNDTGTSYIGLVTASALA